MITTESKWNEHMAAAKSPAILISTRQTSQSYERADRSRLALEPSTADDSTTSKLPVRPGCAELGKVVHDGVLGDPDILARHLHERIDTEVDEDR